MYSGHFSLALVFRKWFPNTSPYVLAVGVGVLDLTFGLLACTGLEGFYIRDGPADSPLGSVGLKCDYSHSLIGTLLISGLYGFATGSYAVGTYATWESIVPGFVAVSSHFVLDWLVHSSDMFLDPFSKIVVGGTGLWDSHPTAGFLLEGGLCLAAGIYAVGIHAPHKDRWTLGAAIGILVFHFTAASTVSQLYAYALAQEDELARQLLTSLVVIILFLTPGLLIGFALTRASRRHQYNEIV